MLEHIISIASDITGMSADIVKIFSTSAGGIYIGASILGRTPRLGIGRAAVLAIRSLFISARTTSVRQQEVAKLRAFMMDKSDAAKDLYAILCGVKGGGKSTLAATATEKTCGVITLPKVGAGAQSEKILDMALTRITGINVTWFNKRQTAQRVCFFYRIMFRRKLILVMQVGERMHGKEYAEIPQAVRDLTDLGIRVIIDSSDNSLPPETFATKREKIFEVEPMSNKMMKMLPFDALFDFMTKHDMEETVLAVCGGNPADLYKLADQWKYADDQEAAIRSFVEREMATARKAIKDMVLKHPSMKVVVDEFKTLERVTISFASETFGTELPDLKKVFRIKYINVPGDKWFLCPINGTTAIALRANFKEDPSFDAIKKLLKT